MSEPTWYVKPDGTRVLVLEVTATIEDGADDYALAAVEMTEDMAMGILAKIDKVGAWHRDDADFMCAEWVDYAPVYFAVDEDFYDSADATSDVTPFPGWGAKGDNDGRTDLDRIGVGHDWAEWTSCVKNSDVRLTTAALTEADLRRYVAGENPWHDATTTGGE
jgi:hypothetical protein